MKKIAQKALLSFGAICDRDRKLSVRSPTKTIEKELRESQRYVAILCDSITANR